MLELRAVDEGAVLASAPATSRLFVLPVATRRWVLTDLSNPSNMTSHDKLLEEYRREYNRVVRSLLLPYATAQDVVKIKEWELPSTIDILMEMQSLGTLSDALSDLV